MTAPAGPDGQARASFRDPSGFVFCRAGIVYRAVCDVYRSNYEQLMSSGLYQALVDEGRLIPHEEVETSADLGPGIYRTLRPIPVPFISYPYEWSFSALKDAALLTLAVQQRALEFGLSLKDASGYNVQFIDGRPILIDTLSFEPYREGEPWVAYRQFCQHFLAPLALMCHTDIRLGQLLRIHIDGIPLDLAARLLPGRTRLSPGLSLHVHLHARSQQRHADRAMKPSGGRFGQPAFRGLIASLESTINGLHWEPSGTEWAGYYDETNYSRAAFAEKARLVAEYLDLCRPGEVWDLGANTGRFARIAQERGARAIAFDSDPAAVEEGYLEVRQRGEKNLLCLLQDLTNPSSGLGWQSRERASLIERGPADCVLALALVHHLAIGNNLPFRHIAEFLARIGTNVIIEFVPKEDSQVRRLLASREDVFPDYRQDAFESVFAEWFETVRRQRVGDSQRTMYLMSRKGANADD